LIIHAPHPPKGEKIWDYIKDVRIPSPPSGDLGGVTFCKIAFVGRTQNGYNAPQCEF